LKILISGGYLRTGFTLAARFVKEGHEVTVIDNLSPGEHVRDAAEKFKFYNLLNSSPECEKVFGAGRFEIVIFIPEYEPISAEQKKSLHLKTYYRAAMYPDL
jgi:UDP-glucuronate decarboxylase